MTTIQTTQLYVADQEEQIMLTQSISRSFNAGSHYIRFVLREVHLCWRFIRYDISAASMPVLIFSLAAWHSDRQDWGALPGVLARSLIYAWLYTVIFCYSNQIAGIQEDRQNKPSRPLVTGEASLHGTWVRWVVVMALFDLVGWRYGVLEWAILWQLCVLLHNFGGWTRHWVGKSMIMLLGAFAQLTAAWQMVRPLTPEVWRWVVSLGIFVFFIVPLQDLRDVAGDQANRRKTLPIAFGTTTTRIMLAVSLALVPVALHWVLVMPLRPRVDALVCDGLLAILCYTIAFRVLRYRTRHADQRSYMLLTYWYCLALASTIVILN